MFLNPLRLRFSFKQLNKFALNRFTSIFLLVLMLPVTLPAIKTSENANSSKVNIKLALNSPSVLASNKGNNNIVPGESKNDKEIREKAEETAKTEAVKTAQAKAAAEASRNTVSREKRVYNDPSSFDGIYAAAGSAYGVDARILKAIHIVETGASGSTSRANPSGAQGPMQFLPSTWKRHAVDGNGDGNADINNVNDAIFTAAAYLKACGYPNVQKALWGYNPSTSYYNKVMSLAKSFGF